jgi:hypothetical protein
VHFYDGSSLVRSLTRCFDSVGEARFIFPRKTISQSVVVIFLPFRNNVKKRAERHKERKVRGGAKVHDELGSEEFKSGEKKENAADGQITHCPLIN